jgi:hypothetical membrane protein
MKNLEKNFIILTGILIAIFGVWVAVVDAWKSEAFSGLSYLGAIALVFVGISLEILAKNLKK